MSHERIENVQAVTEACGILVEDTINGKYTLEEFGKELRRTGISVVEAEDYVQEVKQRLEGRQQDIRPTASATISATSPPTSGRDVPVSSSTPEIEPCPEPSATEVNEEIAWAILTSKLNRLRPAGSSDGPRIDGPISDLLKTLVPSSSSNSSIPPSVLAVAPHLATLSQSASHDEHLHKTWELRQAYNSEKAIDPIIDLMQSQHLPDPIPRSIWRKIIQDEFVDFERLYGSTDRNYSHQDDQKEFAGGFVLTKKEQMSAKKAIRSEAEWSRMFTAWEAGVLLLYPHRQSELQKYRLMVIDLFRATPHTISVPIHFDIEARDRYARSPFHLDDRDMLQIPLLVQLFRGSNSSFKRDLDSPPSNPAKRSTIPCQNWNLGFCDDPCLNRRKHGICCECGGQHRAKEFEGCLGKLHERRRFGTGSSLAASGSSSGHA
ncbi:hypothetical protein BYT27DRAFT_7103856 [Phlegmacium glaucopus]|nr:hypothetical protein BYT27DRAFT_7103856 [Phlegmacium glaucopus]